MIGHSWGPDAARVVKVFSPSHHRHCANRNAAYKTHVQGSRRSACTLTSPAIHRSRSRTHRNTDTHRNTGTPRNTDIHRNTGTHRNTDTHRNTGPVEATAIMNGSYTYFNYSDWYDHDFYEEVFDSMLEAGDRTLMRLRHHLMVCLGLPLVILGTIGNVLCLVVLQNHVFRRTSCGFLLSALAAADIGVLNTGLLRLWIGAFTEQSLDVRRLGQANCKIHASLTYFFPQLSSWTLVLVTVDRVVSVAKPLRAHEICSRCRMMVAWLVVSGVLLALNVFPLWHYNLEAHTTPYNCKTDDPFTKVYRWVDFIFAFLLPLIFISAGNTFIIYMLIKARETRRISLAPQSAKMSGQSCGEVTRSATAMLVSVSLVFFITTIPRTVYFLGLPWVSLSFAKLDLFNVVCILIYNVSNASNFLLYCISGSKFRKTLRDTILCREPFADRTIPTTTTRSMSRDSHLSANDSSSYNLTKIRRSPSPMLSNRN